MLQAREAQGMPSMNTRPCRFRTRWPIELLGVNLAAPKDDPYHVNNRWQNEVMYTEARREKLDVFKKNRHKRDSKSASRVHVKVSGLRYEKRTY